jgi:hypothetical protein
MARHLSACWGCGKQIQGTVCDDKCLRLWQQKSGLPELPIPPTSPATPNGHETPQHLAAPLPPATQTERQPAPPIPQPEGETMRAFRAKDDKWYVEFRAHAGIIYYQTDSMQTADRVMRLMRRDGYVLFEST